MSKKQAREAYKNLRKNIGLRIHKARVNRGWELSALAANARIKPRSLDQYELGQKSMDIVHLFRIAGALKVKVSDLVG